MGAEISAEHLYSVATGQSVQSDQQTVTFWQEHRQLAPLDPAPLLALAELALKNGPAEDALDLLRQAQSLRPDLPGTTARIGRTLYELKRDSELLVWMNTLPEDAALHPGIWKLRGKWAADHEQKEAAARCYWEALKLDPTDSTVCYQLGMTLSRLNREQESKPLLERSRLLEDYIRACEFSRRGWKTEEAAELADQLGLCWEAFAWWKMIAFSHIEDEQPDQQALMVAAQRARQLAELLQRALLSRMLPEQSPVVHLNLSSYPLPDTSNVTSLGSERQENRSRAQMVHFEDQAALVGLNFTYFNGQDPKDGRLLKWFHQMF